MYGRFMCFENGVFKMINDNTTNLSLKTNANFILYIGQYRLD